MLTINQALDKLFIQYKNKDMIAYPDVQVLKQHLIELKMVWGGNTPVENSKEIIQIIKTGKAK